MHKGRAYPLKNTGYRLMSGDSLYPLWCPRRSLFTCYCLTHFGDPLVGPIVGPDDPQSTPDWDTTADVILWSGIGLVGGHSIRMGHQVKLSNLDGLTRLRSVFEYDGAVITTSPWSNPNVVLWHSASGEAINVVGVDPAVPHGWWYFERHAEAWDGSPVP